MSSVAHAEKTLETLGAIAQQSAFVHLSYLPVDQDDEYTTHRAESAQGGYVLVAIAEDGARSTASGSTIEQAVAILGGEFQGFRCSKCKEWKPSWQFPPAYKRVRGKSDGGRQYWCLTCKRAAAKVSSKRLRDERRARGLTGLGITPGATDCLLPEEDQAPTLQQKRAGKRQAFDAALEDGRDYARKAAKSREKKAAFVM